MVRVRVSVGIVIALAIASAGHVRAQPGDDAAALDRAADRVMSRGRYQKLPSAEDADAPKPRPGHERTKRPRRGDGDYEPGDHRSSRQGNPNAGLGTVFQFLLWGVIVVAAVLLVLAIVSEAINRPAAPASPPPKTREEAEAPRAALDRPLDDAERLAREGRFAEAIHILLLRTFQDLTRAAGVTIAPSWTSREVLGRIWLAPDAREALVDLVRMVELTWFGDDVPGEAEWLRCRTQFDRFVTAYRAAPAKAAA